MNVAAADELAGLRRQEQQLTSRLEQLKQQALSTAMPNHSLIWPGFAAVALATCATTMWIIPPAACS